MLHAGRLNDSPARMGFNAGMNATTAIAPLYVSHGSPMIALEPGAAGAFFERLGPAIDAAFGRPQAILALSAHTMAREPVLLAAPRHEAVYDFGGFDPKLSTLRYDAPGAPALADRVQSLLAGAGLPAHRVDEGGLDHGIWTALRYIYPNADVPVLPLAWSPRSSPGELFALGRALAPLADEGVLVLGTGSITHNLRRVFSQGLRTPSTQPEAPDSAAFRAWIKECSEARDWDALFDYRARAPHAVDMHPTDEHLLPFYIAAGAGGREAPALRLHASTTHGVLGMDTYAFGPMAPRLAAALSSGHESASDAAAQPAH
jgi:4,5-DOPA dioxygenase extradiol